MVHLFSLPDRDVWLESSQTVYLCDTMDLEEGLAVIPVTDIHSVVAMFPDMAVSQGGNITPTGKYALMRHAYIELAPFTTGGLFDDDGENNGVGEE